MSNITSINIKKCVISTSEAHNKRTAEYMARIKAEKVYIRQDLTDMNESWTDPEVRDMGLQGRLNHILEMYEKTHKQPMNMKDVTWTDGKGRERKRAGASPIREGVVVCGEDTTMDQLREFCRLCHQRWGITALQVHIHRDEGHWEDGETGRVWKPNLHAHIVWDWMDHNTWKSFKLDKVDMSRMQTLLAGTLHMERGRSKVETGREHLERTDYIIHKQRETLAGMEQNRAALKEETDDLLEKYANQILLVESARNERVNIEGEVARKKKQAAELEQEIKDKRKAAEAALDRKQQEMDKLEKELKDKSEKAGETINLKNREIATLDEKIEEKRRQAEEADREAKSAIKSGVAKFFGKGKYADIENENNSLKDQLSEAEKRIDKKNLEMKQLRDSVNAEIAKIKSKYREIIDSWKEKAEKYLEESESKSKTIAKMKERINALDKLAHPARYRLTSGAQLTHYWIPNRNLGTITVHIWTKVGGEEYDVSKNISFRNDNWERFERGQINEYELVNAVFKPGEQVNRKQAELLGVRSDAESGLSKAGYGR